MIDLMTTVLDLIGLLLMVAAIAVLVGAWSIPAALSTAGTGLLAVSWLIDHRRKVAK